MKKEMEPYEFIAKFEDVDFRRIINKNPNADFIEVTWEPRGENCATGIVLISADGARRIHNAGITKLNRVFTTGLDCDGSPVSGSCGSPMYILNDIGYFKAIYQQLMAYENHLIKVNPIR